MKRRLVPILAALAAAAPMAAQAKPAPDAGGAAVDRAKAALAKELGSRAAGYRNVRLTPGYVCGEVAVKPPSGAPTFERFMYTPKDGNLMIDDGKLRNMFNFVWTGSCD